MIRVNIKITGKVQGVHFRAYTYKKAIQLGDDVTGWVANESDGSVSVIAEGPENKINNLTEWCHSGPSTANVDNVESEISQYTREFDGFSIRY